jgi:hypothetical protein
MGKRTLFVDRGSLSGVLPHSTVDGHEERGSWLAHAVSCLNYITLYNEAEVQQPRASPMYHNVTISQDTRSGSAR